MERSKQNKHLVCNKDNDHDNDVDNSVGNGDNDSVDDAIENDDDGADKYLTHFSQATDCCMMERSKQNKHL
eukprot:8859948-Ditylum_brightwellii.AAC.1